MVRGEENAAIGLELRELVDADEMHPAFGDERHPPAGDGLAEPPRRRLRARRLVDEARDAKAHTLARREDGSLISCEVHVERVFCSSFERPSVRIRS
jgi:hypothetical protein